MQNGEVKGKKLSEAHKVNISNAMYKLSFKNALEFTKAINYGMKIKEKYHEHKFEG